MLCLPRSGDRLCGESRFYGACFLSLCVWKGHDTWPHPWAGGKEHDAIRIGPMKHVPPLSQHRCMGETETQRGAFMELPLVWNKALFHNDSRGNTLDLTPKEYLSSLSTSSSKLDFSYSFSWQHSQVTFFTPPFPVVFLFPVWIWISPNFLPKTHLSSCLLARVRRAV